MATTRKIHLQRRLVKTTGIALVKRSALFLPFTMPRTRKRKSTSANDDKEAEEIKTTDGFLTKARRTAVQRLKDYVRQTQRSIEEDDLDHAMRTVRALIVTNEEIWNRWILVLLHR